MGFTPVKECPSWYFKPGVDNAKIIDLFKFQARVEVTDESIQVDEVPMLVLLGWYLMILQMEDATSASAAAAGAAASKLLFTLTS